MLATSITVVSVPFLILEMEGLAKLLANTDYILSLLKETWNERDPSGMEALNSVHYVSLWGEK